MLCLIELLTRISTNDVTAIRIRKNAKIGQFHFFFVFESEWLYCRKNSRPRLNVDLIESGLLSEI